MTKATLLDANLLCLLVVGQRDRAAIASHPRLKAFDEDDLDRLVTVLDRLGDPILCPHILTEASNLLGFRQTSSQHARWLESLADLIDRCSEDSERAGAAVADPAFLRLGLADAVLLVLASDRHLSLVSDDLQLCLEAERRGIRTINYNYIRDGAIRIDQL